MNLICTEQIHLKSLKLSKLLRYLNTDDSGNGEKKYLLCGLANNSSKTPHPPPPLYCFFFFFFKLAFNSLSNSKASHYSVQFLCHMHSSYSASAYSTSPLISCFSLCLTCLPTPLCLLAVESHPVVFQACRREPANMQMICAEYPVPIEIDRLGLQWTMPAALPREAFM